MANKKEQQKKRAKKARAASANEPPTQAEKVTVAWTLSVLTAFGTQLVAGIAALIHAFSPADPLVLLQRLLIVAAVVAGVLALFLMPVAVRTSKRKLPRTVLLVGTAISVSPMLILAWILIR